MDRQSIIQNQKRRESILPPTATNPGVAMPPTAMTAGMPNPNLKENLMRRSMIGMRGGANKPVIPPPVKDADKSGTSGNSLDDLLKRAEALRGDRKKPETTPASLDDLLKMALELKGGGNKVEALDEDDDEFDMDDEMNDLIKEIPAMTAKTESVPVKNIDDDMNDEMNDLIKEIPAMTAKKPADVPVKNLDDEEEGGIDWVGDEEDGEIVPFDEVEENRESKTKAETSSASGFRLDDFVKKVDKDKSVSQGAMEKGEEKTKSGARGFRLEDFANKANKDKSVSQGAMEKGEEKTKSGARGFRLEDFANKANKDKSVSQGAMEKGESKTKSETLDDLLNRALELRGDKTKPVMTGVSLDDLLKQAQELKSDNQGAMSEDDDDEFDMDYEKVKAITTGAMSNANVKDEFDMDYEKVKAITTGAMTKADGKKKSETSGDRSEVSLDDIGRERNATTGAMTKADGKAEESVPDPTVAAPQKRAGALTELYEKLRNTGKNAVLKFFQGGDSKLYKQMTDQVGAVNSALTTQVDATNYAEKSKSVHELYKAMLKSCREYIETHKNPSTADGKARKALAEQIRDIAINDVIAINNGQSVVESNPNGMTMLDLVASEARSVKINLDERDQSNPDNKVKVQGAGGSNRYKFKQDDKLLFFTPEEKVKTKENAIKDAVNDIGDGQVKKVFLSFLNSKDKSIAGAIHYDSWKEFDPETVTYAQVKADAGGKHVVAAMEKAGIDLGGKEETAVTKKALMELVETAQTVSRAKSGAQNARNNANLKVGSIQSNRNVGMSRIADLLGAGELLAKSENAEITYKGKTTKGNLMDGAKGEEFGDLTKRQELEGADITSGELQRQLTSLQLIDMLCNNVDRHANNMFYDTEKKEDGSIKIKGIQGIDNDLSFGKTERNLKEKDQNLSAVRDSAGKSTLPVVDKDVAEKILALTPEMLELVLADVLTDREEVQALFDRLKAIQDNLRELKEIQEKTGEKTFLDKGDWGDKTAAMLAATGNEFGSNYYGAFVGHVTGGAAQDKNLKNKKGPKTFSAFSKTYVTSEALRSLLKRRGANQEDTNRIESEFCPLLDRYHALAADSQTDPGQLVSVLKELDDKGGALRRNSSDEGTKALLTEINSVTFKMMNALEAKIRAQAQAQKVA